MTQNFESRSLAELAVELRVGKTTARDLAEWAIANHDAHGGVLAAYKTWDPRPSARRS